jgi:hypothetical protein
MSRYKVNNKCGWGKSTDIGDMGTKGIRGPTPGVGGGGGGSVGAMGGFINHGLIE